MPKNVVPVGRHLLDWVAVESEFRQVGELLQPRNLSERGDFIAVEV